MPRVLIFHPREHAIYRSLLEPHCDAFDLDLVSTGIPEVAVTELRQAEILIAANSFPVEALPEAARLRWVHVQGAGVDRWMSAELDPTVRVTRTVGSFGPRMAEYAMAHILAVYQRVHEYRAEQSARRWRAHPVTSLAGRRLGVAGFGVIGTTLAHRAAAFGMTVVGLARAAKHEGSFEVYGQDRLLAFLSNLDVVANVLPLTPSTHHLFDSEAFAAMQPGAWFLNMGRGSTVDEPALVRALESGHLGGAILDVFEEEPLPTNSPLWNLPNVILTPHVAGTTLPKEVVDAFLANLSRFKDNTALLDEVERERAY